MATSLSHSSSDKNSQYEPSAQNSPDSDDCSQSRSKGSNKAKRLKTSGTNHAKASNEVTSSKKSKSPWTKEDEIVILEALVNYSTTDTTYAELYDLLKGSIQGQVTKAQWTAKVGTLRRKYKENRDKGINFVDPHDCKVFKLSEKLWGAPNEEKIDSGKSSKERLSSKHNDSGPDKNIGSDLPIVPSKPSGEPIMSMFNFPGLDKCIKDGEIDSEMITEDQMAGFQEKWNEIKLAELKASLKLAILDVDIIKSAIDTLESFSRNP